MSNTPARDWPIYRVGLTGGIASGKSLVAACFADLGVPVIDTDVLARDVVVPGSPGLRAVVQAFGTGILQPDGSLDRRRLRNLVFADTAARARLDTLLHPLILAAAEQQSRQLPGPYQLFVVPLLYESGFHARVDRIVVVDCPEHLQRQRLMQRDGDDLAQVEGILAAQRPGAALRAKADDHIDNSTTQAATRQRVGELHRAYLELAR